MAQKKDPVALYNKLIEENNLTIGVASITIIFGQNGEMTLTRPQLAVSFKQNDTTGKKKK